MEIMMKESWHDWEHMEEETFEESRKSMKFKKPKKSWKEAKTKRESKRNKGFNKKHSSR
tara:strand:+ start:727 stop:903 length:177 start_codon:yes stop_codon:yes gene_type:complete